MTHQEPEPHQTVFDQKKLAHGWYYEHGTPADFPNLQRILDTPHINKYYAAVAALSIAAKYGFDLCQSAVCALQEFDNKYMKLFKDLAPALALFLRAMYMNSSKPTERSRDILDQHPIQSASEMPYEVLRYVIQSNKSFEGECGAYLTNYGAQGLLENLAYSWQIHHGDYDAIDPILRDAAASHYREHINTEWTEELGHLITVAIGFDQDLPPFLQELVANYPELCMVAPRKKQNTYFYNNEGVAMELPINPFTHFVRYGIEGYPPLLQPALRHAVANQYKTNTFAYLLHDAIDTSAEEQIPIHPDIWDLASLADEPTLFEHLTTDMMKAGVIPHHILQKAYNAPLNLYRYFSHPNEVVRQKIEHLQKLLGIDIGASSNPIDHQLIQCVSDAGEPRPVAAFLRILCQDVEKNLIQTPHGVCATPAGIEAYIASYVENFPGNPKSLRESGLLPNNLTPIQEFAILHPSGNGIRILWILGVISKQEEAKDASQMPKLTYDANKYHKFISGSYPRYTITVEGFREWWEKNGNRPSNIFSYGLLAKKAIAQLNPYDKRDLNILLTIDSLYARNTIIKKLCLKILQGQELAPADQNAVNDFIHTWVFAKNNNSNAEDAIRGLIQQPELVIGQVASEELLARIRTLRSHTSAFEKIRSLFDTKDIAKVLKFELSTNQLDRVAALPYARNMAMTAYQKAEALEIMGDPDHQGASKWIQSIRLLSRKIFGSKNNINESGELIKYLIKIYPFVSFQAGASPPQITDSVRWGFVANASREIFKKQFGRDAWRKLLGKKRFHAFLRALPHLVTFNNSPARRNAFTHNEYDQVTPFVSYLVKHCNITLSPLEFDYIIAFVSRYGLSQNDILYQAFRFVLDKKPGEVSDEFGRIDSLDDIDRILNSLREKMASTQPMLTLPENSFELALFEHEIGYSTHKHIKPPIQILCTQFAEPGGLNTIPEGHTAFEISIPTLSAVPEINFDELPPLLDPFISEITALRSDDPDVWSINDPQRRLVRLIEQAIQKIQNETQVPAFVRSKRITALTALFQRAKDVQTPGDIIRILSSTSFEKMDQPVVTSIYRQSAILQYLRKNTVTDLIPDSADNLDPDAIKGLYNLCVNGVLEHTLAIQEFEHQPAISITRDWNPDISAKVSIIRRMRESMVPLAQTLTAAMIKQDKNVLQMIPDRGIVGELSAYIADACYSRVYPLLSQHLDVVPYKIIHQTNSGPRIIGSFLTFPVQLKTGEQAMLIRALNIPQGNQFDMPAIIKGIFQRMSAINANGNLVLIPGIVGARGEYASVERALQDLLEPQNQVSLSSVFDFNGLDLTDNCYVVR